LQAFFERPDSQPQFGSFLGMYVLSCIIFWHCVSHHNLTIRLLSYAIGDTCGFTTDDFVNDFAFKCTHFGVIPASIAGSVSICSLIHLR
jgi:hypothetical protein